MDYKEQIIGMLDRMDERKLVLVFWHIIGLLGLKYDNRREGRQLLPFP